MVRNRNANDISLLLRFMLFYVEQLFYAQNLTICLLFVGKFITRGEYSMKYTVSCRDLDAHRFRFRYFAIILSSLGKQKQRWQHRMAHKFQCNSNTINVIKCLFHHAYWTFACIKIFGNFPLLPFVRLLRRWQQINTFRAAQTDCYEYFTQVLEIMFICKQIMSKWILAITMRWLKTTTICTQSFWVYLDRCV